MPQMDYQMSQRANSRPKPEICIVGAGPVGLTLALALADAGIPCLVVDRGTAPMSQSTDFDGRAYSISPSCWKIWQALNVSDALEARTLRVTHISAESAGGHPIIFSEGDLEDEGGPLGYMVEADLLSRTLYRRVTEQPLITIKQKCTLSGISVAGTGIDLKFSGEKTPTHVSLLVGCDGRESTVRKQAGIHWFGHDYNAKGLVATAALERPHENAARQSFLKSGPLAILPLMNNMANLVWTEHSDVADVLSTMSDTDFEAELAERIGDFIGGFKLTGPRYTYPLTMRVAENFHADRIAIAGDSAHTIHPLAGQGLNLGLKDVAVMAEKIVEADRVGLDLGATDILRAYDDARRPDVLTTAFAMDGFDKLFSAASPIRTLAAIGMGIVGDIKPARQFLARQTSGEQGDAPRLMRGKAFSLG